MFANRFGPTRVTVYLDFDEHVMRMGFGSLEAVEILREAGIEVYSASGLRLGLLIIDDEGYAFTPTALYLETDKRPSCAPSAMRLTKEQIVEALARLSPATKCVAVELAPSKAEQERILERDVEVPYAKLDEATVQEVTQKLKEAPPVPFDVARQVRVFSAYLQYAELKLSGAALQRRRVTIPPLLQRIEGSEDLEGRLRTTFDLIERDGKLSSGKLEQELKSIRNDCTASLGKDHGRVVLKSAKPRLQNRLAQLREKLKAHKENLRKNLQDHIDTSRKQIVEYLLPRIVRNPPDPLLSQVTSVGETEARKWIDLQLETLFPNAEDLILGMEMEERYKDMTFETLNQPKFLDAVKKAFPLVNWDQAYHEFRAAGEQQSGSG